MRSSSEDVDLSLPALAVTLNAVVLLAVLIVRCASERPRAAAILTVIAPVAFRPSSASCSLSVSARLRLIVAGAAPSEAVSLATLGTATGGVFAVVGAGTSTGAGVG